MTREDAILHMTLRREELKHSVGDLDEDIKAFDMAIEALEQEPCDDWYDVPSDDMTLEQARQAVKDLRTKLAECLKQEHCDNAISRQAVEDAIYDYSRSCDVNYAQIMEYIDKIPSVSTEISELLHKAKSEIRRSEAEAYNADFTMGCEYAISVIERMFEEVEE